MLLIFSISLCFLTHAAIQVQFLQNKSTVDEGSFMTVLTIQLLLTPADATLLFDITIALSVSSGSATGTVHGRVNITTTLYLYDRCSEVILSYVFYVNNRKY